MFYVQERQFSLSLIFTKPIHNGIFLDFFCILGSLHIPVKNRIQKI